MTNPINKMADFIYVSIASKGWHKDPYGVGVQELQIRGAIKVYLKQASIWQKLKLLFF